jgi:tetratricopeptide (TPR) repeat protein
MEERARMTAQDMDSLYNKWPDVIAGARVIMAGVHLGKRQIPEAVRLLNLATAAHPQSEYSWRAWMKLGEINEYEQNLGDAMVMYNLAASVCPSAVPVKWEAIVRKGELARRLSMQDSADVFLKNASGGKHPFALPRLAARYYLSEIGEDDFVRVYCECIGDSSDALYYLARKAIADSDIEKAVSLLDRRLDILSPGSWDYLSTYALKLRLAQ